MESLLPALLNELQHTAVDIYLPSPPTPYKIPSRRIHNTYIYDRIIPNIISRFFEVIFLTQHFDGDGPILVLGDLPLRAISRQTVFVQNSFLVSDTLRMTLLTKIKFSVMKAILRMNAKFVDHFIVQTQIMADLLANNLHIPQEKIFVIGFPPAPWILNKKNNTKIKGRKENTLLYLIYPAKNYWYKNHNLFAKMPKILADRCPIRKLIFTIDQTNHPNKNLTFIECVGELGAEMMEEHYQNADGLLFLSEAESYGFPLVEAMFFGLPIVCPDLPYARELCGDQAIYFETNNPVSLFNALCSLHDKLEQGWMPDWSERLTQIPKDWHEVARSILSISLAYNSKNDAHEIRPL